MKKMAEWNAQSYKIEKVERKFSCLLSLKEGNEDESIAFVVPEA